MNPTEIESQLRLYVANVIHLSLATSSQNRPWATEVHFAYDDDLNLYFRSLTSRRHSQEIATNPHVAGAIVKQFGAGDQPVGVCGVYFEGRASQLQPGLKQARAAQLIIERLKTPRTILEEADQPNGAQFYHIDVKTYYIFGRLDDKPAQKYALPWHT
jgi:uncharacterized protein YhbP (UPF0306 family)